MQASRPIRIASLLAAVWRAALGAGLLGLAACSGSDVQRSFGLVRDAPDEFQVTTRAPLSMPPDYTLRPPQPGAARPQELGARDAAEAALVPQAALASGRAGGSLSAGQQALLDASGPPAAANIRQQIDTDGSLNATDRSFTDRLMFWRPAPQQGVIVDPQGETKRLRENSALGQGVNQGDTPIIQKPRSSGLFDWLF